MREPKYAFMLMCGLLLLAFPNWGIAAEKPSSKGALKVQMALVDQDMQVRPVPLHSLRIVGATGDTINLRTDASGNGSIDIPAGRYVISSVTSVNFQGHSYRWHVETVVESGKSVDLALSNDNAVIERDANASSDRIDAAAGLFQKCRASVFRVEAGLANGTGFLADTLDGVIVTNAHVVENADSFGTSVTLENEARVRAQLLAVDINADVAILRINPNVVRGRHRLPLQNPGASSSVRPGERLIALGFPLHQELTVTTGIASSVREGAIISDVNINHGNSGGPLLNVDGEVLAINTFGDIPTQGGPGVSGSILIGRAGLALATARERMKSIPAPTADPLPVMPKERMNLAALKAYAQSTDPELYEDFSGIDVGGFQVTLQTPAQTFVAVKAHENDVAKDRKKREARAGLSELERYSEVREYRDWSEYVGVPNTPVVSFAIIPQIGETGGSVFRRIMLSPSLKATYRFRGDVRGAYVYRNGELVAPIRGGHAATVVYQDDRWVSLKDVADQGFYIFDAEVLRPDSLGLPPSIVVSVQDLKHPKTLKCVELSPKVVAQAWNDFEAFYKAERPSAAFVHADAKTAKKRKSMSDSGFLKKECDWPL